MHPESCDRSERLLWVEGTDTLQAKNYYGLDSLGYGRESPKLRMERRVEKCRLSFTVQLARGMVATQDVLTVVLLTTVGPHGKWDHRQTERERRTLTGGLVRCGRAAASDGRAERRQSQAPGCGVQLLVLEGQTHAVSETDATERTSLKK